MSILLRLLLIIQLHDVRALYLNFNLIDGTIPYNPKSKVTIGNTSIDRGFAISKTTLKFVREKPLGDKRSFRLLNYFAGILVLSRRP